MFWPPAGFFQLAVWFNIGVEDRAQQASACFILSIEDSMSAILSGTKKRVIFKGGSGSGVNLSPLRASTEACPIRPVGFRPGQLYAAGRLKRRTIQSAARPAGLPRWLFSMSTTRTSKILVWCKAKEEKKAKRWPPLF